MVAAAAATSSYTFCRGARGDRAELARVIKRLQPRDVPVVTRSASSFKAASRTAIFYAIKRTLLVVPASYIIRLFEQTSLTALLHSLASGRSISVAGMCQWPKMR
jgi:hypothetical protein